MKNRLPHPTAFGRNRSRCWRSLAGLAPALLLAWTAALPSRVAAEEKPPVPTPTAVTTAPVTPPPGPGPATGGGPEDTDPVTPPPAPDAQHAALYIEQTYTYASIDGAGQRSRDVLQKMYIDKDRIAIIDSGETVIVDLKNKTVTTAFADKKTYRTEKFDEIRKRIDARLALQRKNYDAMMPGKQKDALYETIKGFLDDEVTYDSDVKRMVAKTPGGAWIDEVKITATRTHNGKTTTDTVLSAKLSREIRLPFVNFNYAEALYYLELATEKMTKQFTGDDALLVPLELKLVLPTGGSVESKIQKFEYKTGFADSFFQPPAGYKDETKIESKVPEPNLEDLER